MNAKISGKQDNVQSDMLAVARQVAPTISAEADAAEAQRHLTDTAVNAQREVDLYSLLVPTPLGGFETDLVTTLKVFREIARADGSAGWCLMAQTCWNSAAGAYLGDSAVKEIFADGPNVIIAGQGMPSGRAERVDGGYRVTGQWGYGSGITHANYIQAGCIMTENGQPVITDSGLPHMLCCALPPDQVEVADNWHVLGLRGTGSYDYSITDVFVPAEYAYESMTTKPLRGGIVYTLGLKNTTALGHTGFALGVGRRALDEINEVVQGKQSAYGLVTDSPSFQKDFAMAEAKMRAADSHCFDSWGAVQQALDRGDDPGLEKIAQVRAATRYAHEIVTEVVSFAYKMGGGVSLRESALQRCFRDIHAGTQHVLVSYQIAQAAGQVMLGAHEPDARWELLGLIE